GTGPLPCEGLATSIARKLDASSLAFFDAIAPIVSADSLDTTRLFRASRYGKGAGDDYWNAPLTEPEYDALVEALRTGEQYQPHHEFDRTPYFEGCLPVEELAARGRDTLLFAGQLTGVEGYTESAATGILAGMNLARLLGGEAPVVPPPTTMLGALYRYVHSADPAHFQPMNANFGLLDSLERPVKDKQKKRELLVQRALHDIDIFARGVE